MGRGLPLGGGAWSWICVEVAGETHSRMNVVDEEQKGGWLCLSISDWMCGSGYMMFSKVKSAKSGHIRVA